MADKIHCIKKTLRLRPEEAQWLQEKSREANLKEAQYLRLLISQRPNDYPEIRSLLKELINEVNHIGININQIVYNHNAKFYSIQDKEQLIAYLKKLNYMVKEVVDHIGN